MQNADLIKRRQNMKRLRTQKDNKALLGNDNNDKDEQAEAHARPALLREEMDKIEEQDEDISFAFSARESKKEVPSLKDGGGDEEADDDASSGESVEDGNLLSRKGINEAANSPSYIKKLKEELRKRLLVDSKMNNMRGVKVVLENIIILLLLVSAILKMNIQSFIYFTLVVIYMKFKTYGAMRLLMDTTSALLFLRLMLILSNYQENISTKEFPVVIQRESLDRLNMTMTFPWMN